jgi:hypothetical protein
VIETIVVGDTTDGPVPFAELLVRHYEERMPIRYLEVDRGHNWGSHGKNEAIGQALGTWVSYMDDDDIYAKGAFITIYDAIVSQRDPAPMIFSMVDVGGNRIPSSQNLIEGNVGTPCIVTPLVPGLVGAWGDRYEGDFDFISSTVDLWGGRVEWHDQEVIAICRPTAGTDWTETT